MRILLAEDDIHISTIARIALEELGGHQVTLASDGEEALKIALSESFDVILMDEMMPKMNGLSVVREYNRQKGSQSDPIIFLSAKSQESDIKDFRSSATGFIPKPFDPAQLCHLISTILGRHQKAA